jgi:hypothetical protein
MGNNDHTDVAVWVRAKLRIRDRGGSSLASYTMLARREGAPKGCAADSRMRTS